MELNFFDWTYLGTFAGTMTAVSLSTEGIKDMPFFKKIPTQIVSWVLAFLIILLSELFTGQLSLASAGMAVFNAAAVSLASNGGYEAVQRLKNTSQTP